MAGMEEKKRRKTKEERLQEIALQKAQLAEAERGIKSSIRAEQKRRETRKAIVLGQLMLKNGVPDWALKMIDDEVRATSDRALFGLGPKA